jgi:hypothetical protein
MKEIKSRIFSKKTDLLICEFTYLTLVDEGKDEFGTSQIYLQPVRKTAELETYRVNTKVSKEQMEDIQKMHGMGVIDTTSMVKSALENESGMMQQKLIRDIISFAGEQNYKESYTKTQMFLHNWFGYTPKVRVKSDDQLFQKIILFSNKIAAKSRKGPADYIIVSGGMAARIMDLPQFVYNDPNQPNLEQWTGYIYSQGNLGGRLSVLIDPNLSYRDMRIIMGSNVKEHDEGIYHVHTDPVFEEFETMLDLVPSVNIVLSQRMALIATDNAHQRYLTFEITEKAHNIITHLINKIFKK